jgi:uncharacterized protein with HEPN domain
VSPDSETLADLVQVCRHIQLFIAGMSAEQFLHDRKTQAAVQHHLLVLGEAAKRISEPLRTQHPEIPWSPMARMRDKLIHAYDLVNLAEVWHTVSEDVPALLVQLEVLLSDTL